MEAEIQMEQKRMIRELELFEQTVEKRVKSIGDRTIKKIPYYLAAARIDTKNQITENTSEWIKLDTWVSGWSLCWNSPDELWVADNRKEQITKYIRDKGYNVKFCDNKILINKAYYQL